MSWVPLIAMILPYFTNAAAVPAQPSSAQIQLALRKLGVVGSVLYVAAHPDDENTNLLAFLSNERHLRTAYLSLTRGDGGQNLIGSEQGPDLGVIRTQELLAARRIDGAEQLFTRARDFGYSKNPDETLRIWGKDAVLADVVRAIRSFRPDVIITRFSPLPSDTHGHHTASAQLALEAFRLAADPSFHPEQLRDGVGPWQARRIYWNRSFWSIKPSDDLSDFIKLDVNGYDPLLGLSYGEMAADSRSMHKSQGFGIARTRGPVVEYFKLLAAAPGDKPAAHGVLDGLDLTWKRIKGAAAVEHLVAKAQAEFVPTAPYKSIPALLKIDKLLDAAADEGWRAQKKAEVRELLVACAGLFVEATAAEPKVVPGGALDVSVAAMNRSPAVIRLRELRFHGAKPVGEQGDAIVVAQAAGPVEVKRRLQVASDVRLSTPHWLVLPPDPGLFRLTDEATANAPVLAPPIQAELVFEVSGRTLSVRRPVTFKWTDPVAGERYQPIEVLPPISVEPGAAVLVLPNGEPRSFDVRVVANSGPMSGALSVEVPAGWSVTPASLPFSLPTAGAEAVFSYRVQPPVGTASGTMRVTAKVGDRQFAARVGRIQHDHIPPQVVLHASDVHVVSFPIDRHVATVGYIPGPGDEVAASLRQAGYDVRMLSDQNLTASVLKAFPVVVIGVRAFNTSEKLRAAQPALMTYVQDGGTVVAQYNTNNRLAPLSAPIGPFPFEIGSERVTDETSAVTLISPMHRLLTWPNRIGSQDFDGWVQERGLYFAKSWDSRYETIVRMNDPGERALDGSVLFGRYGKGAFVYTGLSFFRELPAGVPGAFRLLANLLAAGQPHGQ
jgi:LmbE family N-acetylglucosaminyl deacetylase/phosphatidylserine decarboxylase